MQKVLGFVKSNLISVIAVAVAVIAIGVMLFFSFRWNSGIRKSVTKDVSDAVGKLNALNVTYELPAVTPGQEKWSSPSQRPNAMANQAVGEALKKIAQQSDEVRALAEERNARTSLLVADLFPAPANESARVRLLTQLVQRMPEASAAMLKRHGIGMPPEAATVGEQLTRLREREVRERLERRVEQKLTPEEEKQIQELLSKARAQLYAQAAGVLTAYGDQSIFASLQLPKDGALPTLDQAWDWQHTYWIHDDILSAVVKANTNASGARMPVTQAPVKRILSIRVPPASFLTKPSGGSADPSMDPSMGGTGGGMPAPAGDPSQEITKDFTRSLSGRPLASGLYDVRIVEVDLLVDANRVPALLEAIAATNFMTVIDMDLRARSPFDDLARGFAYGNDYLVEARLTIETVWLRSWMKKWMPPTVRTALGIPDDPPPTDQPVDPNAPPPSDGMSG